MSECCAPGFKKKSLAAEAVNILSCWYARWLMWDLILPVFLRRLSFMSLHLFMATSAWTHQSCAISVLSRIARSDTHTTGFDVKTYLLAGWKMYKNQPQHELRWWWTAGGMRRHSEAVDSYMWCDDCQSCWPLSNPTTPQSLLLFSILHHLSTWSMWMYQQWGLKEEIKEEASCQFSLVRFRWRKVE